MRFALFTHSAVSCWNHGNAHFLRGIARALADRGHEVSMLEPTEGWSCSHLVADQGEAAIAAFAAVFPDLDVRTYSAETDCERMIEGAEVVIVHEWTAPEIIAALGRVRADGGRFTLLFHDTHHRAVSDPAAMRALDLAAYDGVLTFGETLAAVYRRWGWDGRAFVWHEAADISVFRPAGGAEPQGDLVFIGNWGDEERSAELGDYLFRPAQAIGASLDVHGVRYPQEGLDRIAAAGGRYRGWIANADVPEAFARHKATVHVPRRQYAKMLPGIPTIRVFEALACGIPLVSAPWQDSEGLFRVGTDFLMAQTPAEMALHLAELLADRELRAELAQNGLETIRQRHTCGHRADELLAILAHKFDRPATETMVA